MNPETEINVKKVLMYCKLADDYAQRGLACPYMLRDMDKMIRGEHEGTKRVKKD